MISSKTLIQSSAEVLPCFEEIQSTGLPASKIYFENLYKSFTDDMIKIQNKLSEDYYDSRPINPGSREDSVNFILNLGITSLNKLTKTGDLSTSKDAIEHLRYLDGPPGDAMRLFFNWREVSHRRNAFCWPILSSMSNRTYCGTSDIYNIVGRLRYTRIPSRRLAMSKENTGINLLAVPVRKSAGMEAGLNKKIRKGFVCPPGEVFVAADLSQIELRVLADWSRDSSMLDVYNNDLDIHDTTMRQIFPDVVEYTDSQHRKPAKNVNFLMTYGGRARKLYSIFKQLNINQYSVDDCKLFIKRWYDKFSEVKKRKSEVLNVDRNRGYSETCVGARRYLPNLNHPDNYIRSKAEREAISHIIQGTAQDVIQNSMGWLHKEIAKTFKKNKPRLALQLHDELLYRCLESQAVDLLYLLSEGLEKHHGMRDLLVPIKSDGVIGLSWADL